MTPKAMATKPGLKNSPASGTPAGPGVSVFIVAAYLVEGKTVLIDARPVTFVAE